MAGVRKPNKHVILRRGNQDLWGLQLRPMPRREDLPLFYFVVSCKCCVSAKANSMVDCHRIAWQVIAYQQGVRIQFFAMTQFISRVLKIIPALLRCSSIDTTSEIAVKRQFRLDCPLIRNFDNKKLSKICEPI